MRISRDLLKIQRPNGSGGNLLRSTLGHKIYLDFLSPFGRTIISYLPFGRTIISWAVRRAGASFLLAYGRDPNYPNYSRFTEDSATEWERWQFITEYPG